MKMNLNFEKMKKLLLTVIATIMMAGSISAQNVARECVLVEAFTGIACGFCPAAAGGIAEMLNQGLSVAPLAFHSSAFTPDGYDYVTPDTDSRNAWYSIKSYPTVIIDGVYSPYAGGVASQYLRAYDSLKASYDKRINVTSPFKLDLTYEYDSWNKCRAKVVVNQVGECDGDNVRVFIALAESHVPQIWNGGTELNAVVRDVVTSTAGTKFTGETQEITALFDVHNYKKENCTLVAWVQNNGKTREVYQAVKISIGDVVAEYDLGISKVESVPTELCSGKIKPAFIIKNHGTQPLISAAFNVYNGVGDNLGSYIWEGALSQGQESYFQLPELNLGNTGSIRIEAVNLNGDKQDEYTFDNVFEYEETAPFTMPSDGVLTFQLKTSEPENLSIDIVNVSEGKTVKTLKFDNEAGTMIKEDYKLPSQGCYRIILRNSEGNGIGDINSFWGVLGGKKEICVAKQGEKPFKYKYFIEVVYGSVGVEDVVAENVNVYPNPAKSVVNVYAENLNKVTAYNSIGQVVYTQAADSDNMIINVESWTNGLYYINLETKDGAKSAQKVVVNK